MIYITGDTHRDFTRILFLTYQNKTTIDDIIIILGDAGINFGDKATDDSLKKQLSQEPITFFCIHGNHGNLSVLKLYIVLLPFIYKDFLVKF